MADQPSTDRELFAVESVFAHGGSQRQCDVINHFIARLRRRCFALQRVLLELYRVTVGNRVSNQRINIDAAHGKPGIWLVLMLL